MYCDCSDDNLLHFGAIVCMLGTCYKSYCSNVVRTLLVEPTAEMQANYDLLLRVEKAVLNALQHGLSVHCDFLLHSINSSAAEAHFTHIIDFVHITIYFLFFF